ncbi:hypothetical protein EB796_025173 [Bugula neritina]|uniref:SH3 domain-containing protein n=1 Tax=Bugula neritina TaxID=10212 RepID=A0A7J7ITH4_BUGNE|nr:hypothetical protein EB796_025173 [Bugula neritina]
MPIENGYHTPTSHNAAQITNRNSIHTEYKHNENKGNLRQLLSGSSPKDRTCILAVVLEDFTAHGPTEISVKKDDEIYIMFQLNDWAYVACLSDPGLKGYIPLDYCLQIENFYTGATGSLPRPKNTSDRNGLGRSNSSVQVRPTTSAKRVLFSDSNWQHSGVNRNNTFPRKVTMERNLSGSNQVETHSSSPSTTELVKNQNYHAVSQISSKSLPRPPPLGQVSEHANSNRNISRAFATSNAAILDQNSKLNSSANSTSSYLEKGKVSTHNTTLNIDAQVKLTKERNTPTYSTLFNASNNRELHNQLLTKQNSQPIASLTENAPNVRAYSKPNDNMTPQSKVMLQPNKIASAKPAKPSIMQSLGKLLKSKGEMLNKSSTSEASSNDSSRQKQSGAPSIASSISEDNDSVFIDNEQTTKQDGTNAVISNKHTFSNSCPSPEGIYVARPIVLPDNDALDKRLSEVLTKEQPLINVEDTRLLHPPPTAPQGVINKCSREISSASEEFKSTDEADLLPTKIQFRQMLKELNLIPESGPLLLPPPEEFSSDATKLPPTNDGESNESADKDCYISISKCPYCVERHQQHTKGTQSSLNHTDVCNETTSEEKRGHSSVSSSSTQTDSTDTSSRTTFSSSIDECRGVGKSAKVKRSRSDVGSFSRLSKHRQSSLCPNTKDLLRPSDFSLHSNSINHSHTPQTPNSKQPQESTPKSTKTLNSCSSTSSRHKVNEIVLL